MSTAPSISTSGFADEGKRSTSFRSPGSIQSSFNAGESISGKSSKKVTINEKLEEINKKLAEVKQQRLEFENKDRKPTKRASTSSSTKRSFHHPKLEYVIGEIVHSPYMTKPQEAYPTETFRVQEKLRELKRNGSKLSEIPKEERPFDMEETKSKFIEEVIKYNVTYTLPEDKLPASVRKSFSVRKSMAVGSSSGADNSLPSTPAIKSRASSLPNMGSKEKLGQRKSFQSSSKSKHQGTVLPPVNSYEQQVQSALFKVQEEFAEIVTNMKDSDDSKRELPTEQEQLNLDQTQYEDDFDQTGAVQPETKLKEEEEPVSYHDDFDEK